MLATILNSLHFFVLFIPFLIYFVPKKYVGGYYKYIFLLLILTPLHWKLFDNSCILSLFTKNAGDLNNLKTDSPFSEKYLRWLYEPIMKLIGWKWNNDNLEKMINLNWIVIFIFLWYYIFFFNRNVVYK